MPPERVELNDIFNHYFDANREEYERTPGWYYSSEGWRCPAKVKFQFELGDRDLPHGVFERGNRAENFVKDALKEEYGNYIFFEVPVKVEVTDEITVSGRIDALLMDYNLEPKHIYEIKSKAGHIYQKERPQDSHYHQILHYMKALGVPGSVIYVNTGDYQDKQEVQVEFNQKDWDEQVMQWVTLHDQFTNDHYTPAPKANWECYFYRRGDKHLVLCPYYHECGDYAGGPVNKVPDSLWEKALNIEKPDDDEDIEVEV